MSCPFALPYVQLPNAPPSTRKLTLQRIRTMFKARLAEEARKLHGKEDTCPELQLLARNRAKKRHALLAYPEIVRRTAEAWKALVARANKLVVAYGRPEKVPSTDGAPNDRYFQRERQHADLVRSTNNNRTPSLLAVVRCGGARANPLHRYSGGDLVTRQAIRQLSEAQAGVAYTSDLVDSLEFYVDDALLEWRRLQRPQVSFSLQSLDLPDGMTVGWGDDTDSPYGQPQSSAPPAAPAAGASASLPPSHAQISARDVDGRHHLAASATGAHNLHSVHQSRLHGFRPAVADTTAAENAPPIRQALDRQRRSTALMQEAERARPCDRALSLALKRRANTEPTVWKHSDWTGRDEFDEMGDHISSDELSDVSDSDQDHLNPTPREYHECRVRTNRASSFLPSKQFGKTCKVVLSRPSRPELL